MNPLFTAAIEVQDLCRRHGWGFCFIGGLAVLRWVEPRLTRDIDLTILAEFGREIQDLAHWLKLGLTLPQ